MSFWQTVKAWLSTEARDAADVAQDVETRLSGELDRREQRLAETPTEALERLQSESSENQSLLDELGDKIGGLGAKADAISDLTESDSSDQPNEDPAD